MHVFMLNGMKERKGKRATERRRTQQASKQGGQSIGLCNIFFPHKAFSFFESHAYYGMDLGSRAHQSLDGVRMEREEEEEEEQDEQQEEEESQVQQQQLLVSGFA